MEATSALSIPRLRVPRTARRRRRRNKSRLRLPASALKGILLSARWVSLLLLVACAWALALIGMEDDFYLTMIPVEGVAAIPPAEIVHASGLAGAHIFAAEPSAAAERIADLPGVITATVRLEWPNEAHVRIGEQSPVAVWEQNGQTYWIDDGGQMLPARTDALGLPRIKVEGGALSEAPGPAPAVDESAGDGELQPEAASVAKSPLLFVPQDVLEGALRLRALQPKIDPLYYDASGGLSYEDSRGWRAYFGTGNDMAQKLAVYEALVEHLEAEGITPAYVSVSNQQAPFYRER